MLNNQVYMLQFISEIYGPRDFVAINEIDRDVIIGDAASTWRLPVIDVQVAEPHELLKVILAAINHGYRLVVTSHNTNFAVSSCEVIDWTIKLLERRYYMSKARVID
ncbi:hypothetical protein MOO44_00795 (plasmid) [Nicoliella spurrieriana]|uniref:Uncharacterized protein n=1 Tax=Nicoliella spurrieriana TaxID=2925830 RepID=A0A976RQU9_9LACO|nr:hypothetical protein [Nicoliella spurrieriana]UQS86210.1 hypothetical protein MOO44_00795 [Nicoliella spurrieriana]